MRLPDERLQQLLDVAQEGCQAYAPALTVPAGQTAPVPASYKEACVLQARDIAQAATRDTGSDLVGLESYAVRVRPMSAVVRQLLRPATRPVVG